MATHREALARMERKALEEHQEELQRMYRKALRRDFYNGRLLIMTRGHGLSRPSEKNVASGDDSIADIGSTISDGDSAQRWLGTRRMGSLEFESGATTTSSSEFTPVGSMERKGKTLLSELDPKTVPQHDDMNVL
uniref:Uncharacterized protein n=1 Tax=Cyclophora tenuis TaxID=216820 RepID=A0A7S1CXH3_CYCTE|mmetsp:Transcript_13292/g.22626  ORF Transcript_13292/g.22626 Transcript_13292/m.22626 type:complete len:135 (+) Transcript_13292:152-556(+)